MVCQKQHESSAAAPLLQRGRTYIQQSWCPTSPAEHQPQESRWCGRLCLLSWPADRGLYKYLQPFSNSAFCPFLFSIMYNNPSSSCSHMPKCPQAHGSHLFICQIFGKMGHETHQRRHNSFHWASTNLPTEDPIALGLHKVTEHLEGNNTYVRMLFINHSSAFNTILPDKSQNYTT